MGTHYLPLLISLFLLLLPAAKSDLAADTAALIRLSAAVLGRTLNWNRSDPGPCLWEGVQCDATTNRVVSLRLPADALTGEIPANTVGNLTQLRVLSLRRNSLSGSLPSDLGSLSELRELFLQENHFSGEIPRSLFALSNLARLSLAVNNFSGEIPVGFNNLTSLRTLHLENNNLIGSIPDLEALSQLREFNVSFNRLNGSIPPNLQRFGSESFLGNSLCGSPLESCPTTENGLSGGVIAGIVIGSVSGFLLIFVISLIFWRKHKKNQTRKSSIAVKQKGFEFRSSKPVIGRESSGSSKGYSGRAAMGRSKSPSTSSTSKAEDVIKNDGLVFFKEGFRVFNLEDLLRASAEILGKGTFGMTYRAYLGQNTEVVVKRLKNVCVPESEFREKIEGLGFMEHENLVALRAYYYGKDEKLLVYDCMPMGSLAALLHGNRRESRSLLTWKVRSGIAYEAALGIKYLHSLTPHFSHGNITSSNILLTHEFGARVSDFGLPLLVSSDSTMSPNGYRAPEVTNPNRISQKADVYSFGVLLLELLTGKNPSHELKEGGEGIDDLPTWVTSVVKEKWTIDVFDSELLKYQNHEEEMVQLLHLAMACASRYPDRRPSMLDLTKRMEEFWRRR